MGRDWRQFLPKTVTVLRQDYGLGDVRADLIAGLTGAGRKAVYDRALELKDEE